MIVFLDQFISFEAPLFDLSVVDAECIIGNINVQVLDMVLEHQKCFVQKAQNFTQCTAPSQCLDEKIFDCLGVLTDVALCYES